MVFAVRVVADDREMAVVGLSGTQAVVVLAAGLTLAGVALLVRRRAPWGAIVITTVVGCCWVLAGYPEPGSVLPAAVAVYSLARRTRTVPGVVATLVSAAAFTGTQLAVNEQTAGQPPVVVPALMLALSAALGLWQRSRHALAATHAQQLRRLEEAQEEQARRRVAEDRLRIARELHDVIAHNMAVISVQAAAAEKLLDTDRERARSCLRQVHGSGRAVLDELGTVLRVLRAGGVQVPDGSSPAALPLAGLGGLVDGFEGTGIAVELRRHDLPFLEEEIELVAYRVVQESLTNALRHAPGSQVLVTVRPAADGQTPSVVLVVENGPATGPPQKSESGGHGLAGMRERVVRVGGDVRAGPRPDGGFRVEATIPLTTGQTAGAAAAPPTLQEPATR